MSIQAKVSPVSQNVSSSEAFELSTERVISLQESSNVALNIPPEDVAGYSKSGSDLIVQLKSGETIRIANFYTEGAEPSQLFLVEDDKLVAVILPPAASDGALLASYVPQESLAGFESLTSGEELSPLGALLIGAGVIAGGAAIASGSGGGGSSSGGSGNNPPPSNPTDITPPAAASDVKISPDGKVITGKAEPGATVEIDTNGDGKPDVIVVAGPDGTFQGGLNPPLTNGENVTVVVKDPSGNTSPPTNVTAPDTTAPTPAENVQISPDGSTITGKAEPGATVEIDTDGDGEPDVTVVADDDGNFQGSLNPPLTNGETVTVVVTDPAGNSSPPTNVTAPDTTAPDAASDVQISPDGSTITGKAEPGATVDIDTDGDGEPDVTVQADDDGNFQGSLVPPLTNGETVTVVVTDPSGNSSPPTNVTAPDSTAPDAASNVQISPDGSTITGKAEPGADVEIDTDGDGVPDVTVVADGNGNFQGGFNPPLTNGETVTVVVTDPAGNSSPPVTITAPDIPDMPTINPSNGSVLSGTAEVGMTIGLSDGNGNPIGQTTVDSSGNWTFTPATPLADGVEVIAVAKNAGGETSPPASTIIDGIAPATPTVNPSNGQEFSGTGEAGTTIELTDGSGNVIGQTLVDDQGNWTYTPATAQPDGAVVTVIAVDPAGNASPPVTVTVDALAPAAPNVNPSDGSVLSGTAEAGSTVVITDSSGNTLAEVPVDGSGNWSYVPATPIADESQLSVIARDEAGNESPVTTITVDSSAPNAPQINPSNGSELSGTAEANAIITLTDGNNVLIAQVTADGSGNWTYTPASPLPDGTVVRATATDAAGNTSGTSSTTVDGLAPPAPVINPSNGTVISGTAEPGATIILTDGAGNPIGQTMADGSGNWTYTPPTALSDSTVVNAVAQDAAGNTGPGSSITVDALAPATPTINNSNGSVINGTAEADSTVRLEDGSGNLLAEVQVDGSGNWSYTPATPLADGTVVTATATDAAGNTSPPASMTVDSSLPSIPQVNPTNGSQISGTADADNTITITDGSGNPIGQVTADGSGNWSFTPGIPLPDGTVVNVVARNPAGTDSAPAVVTVDGVAPGAPVINPSNGSEISGTAEAGAKVILTDGSGNPIGQVTADGSGNWSFTPGTPLAHDTVINAVAQDAAGNTSTPGSVTVDSVAPAAPLVDPSNGTTISGTAEANAKVVLRDADDNIIAEVDADGSGVWSYTPATPLPDGTVVTVTASDASGNTSAPGSVTVDALAPAAPVVNPSNGSEISGTAEAGSTVILTDGAGNPIGQATADGSGNWSFTPGTPLGDGVVINAEARDAAGNTGPSSSITVDAVPPAAPVIQPSNGTTLSGTAEANSTVILTGSDGVIAEVPVSGGGVWSYTPSPALADGTVVSAVAKDAAGNQSTAASTTVDAQAPSDPTINLSNGSLFSGTGEVGSLITLTGPGGAPLGQTTVDPDGTWTLAVSPAQSHGATVTATASDAAGNTSGSVSTVVDAQAPDSPEINPSNGQTLSGTAEAGAVVTLTDGSGNPVGQITADGSGNWSYTPGTPLADGVVVNATATDAAGNVSPSSSVVIDAIAPATPTLNPSDGTSVDGKAEAGSTVVLTFGSPATTVEVLADSQGNWTYTFSPALADGAVVTAIAKDAAGNESGPGTVTVDALAPAAPTVEPSNGSGLSGTAEPNTTLIIRTEDGTVLAEVPVGGSGNWVYNPGTPIAHDTVIEVLSQDAAGNTSPPASVTIDSQAPAAPVINPTQGDVLSGTAEAGASVSLTFNGNTVQVTADGSGNWSYTPGTPLAHGTVVTATASDATGNTSGSVATTVDSEAPAAPVLNLTNGEVITGTAEAGSTVIISAGGTVLGQATADGSGNWSFTPGTPLAHNTQVQAIAKDAAGNESGPGTVTVDAEAPNAPTVNTSNGNVVNGTAEPLSTITLTDGDGNPLGETTADSAGNWSLSFSPQLANGLVISATATDATGNTSQPGISTVDTSFPTTPVVHPSNGSVVEGTADAGNLITITVGGTTYGPVTVAGDGTWTFTPGTPWTDGTVITVVAENGVGTQSAPASVTVDAVAPGAPTVEPTNGESLSGTAEAGSTVLLTDGSGNPIGETTADGSGNWSFTPITPLNDGDVVQVQARDAAGNTSGTVSVTVDAQAPATPVVNPTNGVVLTGTAEAGASVVLTDGSGNPIGTATADASGNWSYTPSPALANGTVVNAVAKDAAGNTSGPASVTVDNVAPATPVLNPSDGTVLSGTGEAGSTVVLTDGSGTAIGEALVDSSGNWTYTPGTPLAHETVVRAQAKDESGNTSGQVSIIVDNVAPATPVINPSNGSELSGTAEAGVSVVLTDGGGQPIAVVTADGSGNWTYTPDTPLSNGTVVNAVARDATGNTSGPASTTVDSQAPAAPVINPSNGSLLAGTAEPGAKVLLTDGDNNVIGEAVAGPGGNWSLSVSPALANGTVVNAVAQDAAGNTSPSASITTDSLAPAAPVVEIAADGSVISGTAEPNSTVLLVINGDSANPIQVPVDGSGNYSHTLAVPLEYGDTVSATARDAAGNVSPSTSVGYFDTSTLTLTVVEAADGWININEAADGIQVKVDLRPTMLPGQQILVKLDAADGYKVEVLHTLTAEEIAAGSVTVTVQPLDASNPFPQGSASITAEVTGGPASAASTFGIDTIAPPALVGSALSLVGNVLTISTEPQTKLTVTMQIAGTEVTNTVYADNNGLVSLDLLQGFGVNFRPDQLFEAKLNLQGEDQAGNTTPVAQFEVSDLLLGIATAGDFNVNLTLANLGLTGTANPGQEVEVLLQSPLVNLSLTTLADPNGDFNVNFIDALVGAGINISDLLGLNNLGFKVNLKDEYGNTESSYGIEVGLFGMVVTVLGTSGNDVMVGHDGAERFDAGAGNDLILNVGAGDVAEAGTGDDAIQLTSLSYSGINGGDGFDTVMLGQGINLNNVTALNLSNIERIDMSATGANQLTLNTTTVRAITDSNNVLRITGESDDSVTLTGATKGATTTENGVTYDVYNLGTFLNPSQVWVEVGTVNVNA